MAYTPFRYRRDEFDMDRERAEDAADTAQARYDAALDAAVAHLKPAELQAAAMKAEEERQALKHLPIGTTVEQARKKGWAD